MTAGTLRENVEDEQRPVIDRHAHVALQIALLSGTQGLVEENFLRTDSVCQRLDFIGLARAHKQRGIGCLALAGDSVGHLITGCTGQLGKFIQCGVEMGLTQIDTHQNDARSRWTPRGRRAQAMRDQAASSAEPVLNWTGRPGTMVEMACL